MYAKYNRWGAGCGENRMSGASRGKSRRLYQRLTYRNKVTDVLEDWAVYESGQKLMDTFHNLGYEAGSLDELELLLEEQNIRIHAFENPYNI